MTSSLGSQTLEFVYMGIDASLQASLHGMLVWKQLLKPLKNLRKKKPPSTTDQALVTPCITGGRQWQWPWNQTAAKVLKGMKSKRDGGGERDWERQKDRTDYKSHGSAFHLVRNATTSAYFTLRKSSYQDFHETPFLLNRLLSEWHEWNKSALVKHKWGKVIQSKRILMPTVAVFFWCGSLLSLVLR